MPDTKIVFHKLPSPLGEIIAGATDNGVCFLEWCDRNGLDRIKQYAEKRCKSSLRPGNNMHLEVLERELAGYFAGTLRKFTVPLEVTGTVFEQKVWDQLLIIPYGETRSYGQLAAAIGSPGASRAVGRANGANHVAVIIPCHRVIDAGGNLHGYGGGLWRKQRLLELEGARQPELRIR